MVSDNASLQFVENPNTVLILVVMEYGLRPYIMIQKHIQGLNPCCNGIWSQTIQKLQKMRDLIVLILVVMEYGLRPIV